MKISKQYLKQLIMEELEEAIEVPGGPRGHYDDEEKKFSMGSGPNPSQNLSDLLISLQVAIKNDNKEEATRLVNAVRSMVTQFSRSDYTGGPEHDQDFIEKIRTGKSEPYQRS